MGAGGLPAVGGRLVGGRGETQWELVGALVGLGGGPLGREGVAIALSRISTQNGAAIDTFYVTDSASGNKITDSHRITGLQKRLQSIALREA